MSGGPPDKPSDVLLMAALAAGDKEALSELVRRHQSAVLSTAYRLLGRWDRAEDVAQEAFIRVYRSASTYRPSAAFSTWLYRIVVNLCRDELRRRRPTSEPPEDLSNGRDAEPSDVLEQTEQVHRIRRAVARLPERQRVCMILHRYAGLSHEQIAEATGWSISAIESCLVRGYAQLREDLADLRGP